MKKLFFLIIWLISALPLFGQNIEGTWNGQLEIGPQKLRIIVNFVRQDSLYVGTLDSPDQGAKGIPLSTVDFNVPNMSFEIGQLGVVYKGIIQGDTLITGTFTQSGYSFPLSLTKKEIVVNRPQEPKPPYPYNSQEVSFPGKSPDVTLAGTLTIPKQGSGTYPAVILVSGSGLQNRDEELFDHKPFFVMADYLTRNGIAVLRYDDRGVGESSGDFGSATTTDFLEDALGAFDYLALRPEINHNKIGIIGHSEGGTIAFMAAARKPEIAFIISLAGAAVRGDFLLIRQNRDIMLAQGLQPDLVDIYCTALQKSLDIIKDHSHDHIVQNSEQISSGIFTPEKGGSLPKELQKNLTAILTNPISPWLKYFLSLDPAPYIEAVKCYALALNGSNDLQVNAEVNLAAIEKNLKTGGNTHYTTRKYDGLNHLFQHSTTGLVSEYGQIEETISPEVLSDITGWILKML